MAVPGLEARLGGDQRAVRRVQLLVGRRRRRERLLRLLLFLPRELRAKKTSQFRVYRAIRCD